MNRLGKFSLAVMLLLALLCMALPAAAQVIDSYEYVPNHIYTVRTGLGITTQIALDPNEQVLDYSTGFSSGWELTRRDNVFYLKPKNVDVDTNMMVRTATHDYIFELKVVATDWTALEQAKRAGVQYKITFKYPQDASFATEADPDDAQPAQLDTAINKSRNYNFNYQFASRGRQPWLIPVNVYDDGRFTYVRMSDLKQFPTGNFPAIFGRESEDGDDFVVNTTVEDNTLVVHGTYPYLVIRHGSNVVGLRRVSK